MSRHNIILNNIMQVLWHRNNDYFHTSEGVFSSQVIIFDISDNILEIFLSNEDCSFPSRYTERQIEKTIITEQSGSLTTCHR
jgi:hypothetical protein